MTPDKIAATARALVAAERDGTQIGLVSLANPGMTMDDAYAIQSALMAQKLAGGRRVIGWKIGLTSKAMQYALGIDTPDSGVLFDDMDFPDGAVIPAGRFIQPRIEAEIAFEDETGVGVSTRYGRTWGECGKTPEVPATDQRGKYNVLSTVSAQGNMRYSATEKNIDSQGFIRFLKQLLHGRTSPLILLLDRASFHGSKLVRDFVRAHRTQIRVFFLPRHAPEYNPDEQVWDEIKVNKIGRQPVKDKPDLKRRLYAALASLQSQALRIHSFFQLPETQYAGESCMDISV